MRKILFATYLLLLQLQTLYHLPLFLKIIWHLIYFSLQNQILMATFLTRIFFIAALFSFVFPWRSSDSWSWDADESRNSESDEYLNEVEDLPDSIDWRGITSPKITL